MPNTQVVVEPKAKKKYKTKKEKEKDTYVEELMITTQTMVMRSFFDEKAQSLKDLVEEMAKLPPQNTKKKNKER
jgi:hypothetical protein